MLVSSFTPSQSHPILLPSSYFLFALSPPRSSLFPYTTLFRSTKTHNRLRPGLQRVSRRIELPQSPGFRGARAGLRSEEHTSELQSRGHLVCRLLLEKKKKYKAIVVP